MKQTLATLTTIVVLGLTPIAASADAGTEDTAPTSRVAVDHDQAMMNSDHTFMQAQVGAGMTDHVDGGPHTVMPHSDDGAMIALMKTANPAAMHALMRGGPANQAGGMP